MKKIIVVLTIICVVFWITGCKKSNEILHQEASGKLSIQTVAYTLYGITPIAFTFTLYEITSLDVPVSFKLDWGTDNLYWPPRIIQFSLFLNTAEAPWNEFKKSFNSGQIKLYWVYKDKEKLIWTKTITKGVALSTTEHISFN
ncbi:MAG: hypothetical protein KAT34_16180 [Candidatus Aminicenantes bacterium]|nr:hypothetical protein [Candidatus Aminicenantes bacterium]